MDSSVKTIDQTPGAVADRYGLTSREKQILRLLALGKSDREISIDLDISIKTVNVHVSNIIFKLAVNNRAHAVAKSLILRQIEMRVTDFPHAPTTKQNGQRKVVRINEFKQIKGTSIKRSDDD
jgi:DNA-binding CsgD family transcriptional regulator